MEESAAVLLAISDPALCERSKTPLLLLPELCAVPERRQGDGNVPWIPSLL